MTDDHSRLRAVTEQHAYRAAPSLRERLPAALAAVLAASAFVALMFFAIPAQGGTGGVGPAGIDGDSAAAPSTVGRYAQLWRQLPPRDKSWARRTSECESGGNRAIHGGGGLYHGAFQFMRSTWAAAPKSPGGDPHAFSWRTQAVVAVSLMRRDGAGHWPNCG